MTTPHAQTCPVAAPDWAARYANHDFDACTCHVFCPADWVLVRSAPLVALEALPQPIKIGIRESVYDERSNKCQ